MSQDKTRRDKTRQDKTRRTLAREWYRPRWLLVLVAVITPFYMPNVKVCREQEEDRTMAFKKEVAQLNRQLQMQAGEVFDIYKRTVS
jgi:hypothetical protein